MHSLLVYLHHLPHSRTSSTTSPTSSKETYSVIITSFGPFPNGRGGHYNINASNEIAKALPPHIEFDLPPADSKDETTRQKEGRRRRARVNILNPTAEQDAYVKTEYGYTRRYIQQLHDDIDASSPTLGRPLHAASNASSPKVPLRHPHAPPSTETTKPPPPTSPNPTLIIHLGQASYCNDPPSLGLERLAFSQSMRSSWWKLREAQQGYHRIPDDKGEVIDNVDGGRDPWAAKDVPAGLGTALDIDQVAIFARAALSTTLAAISIPKEEDEQAEARKRPPRRDSSKPPSKVVPNDTCWIHSDKHKDSECYTQHSELRPNKDRTGKDRTDVSHKTSGLNLNITTHHEAGPYLCGFIYYESLAQCYTRDKRADVLFCHVPAMLGEKEVTKGRNAVFAVVEGAMRWLIEQEEREVRERVELLQHNHQGPGSEPMDVREVGDGKECTVEDVM